MDVNTDDAQLLTEVGYAAAVYGLAEPAQPIFEALIDVLPNNAAGAIGFSIAHIMCGRFNDAVEVLEKHGLNAEISSEEARAVHLLAVYLSGRKDEARVLSEELLQGEGAGRSMASSLFG